MEKKRISNLSRFLKWTFVFVGCLLPILDAGFWITNGYPFLEKSIQLNFIPEIGNIQSVLKPLSEMAVLTKFLGFLVTLIPIGINVAIFALLAKLFKTFEQLDFFSETTVQLIKKIGTCILVNQLIYPFYMAILSLTLTLSNTPGTRMISVSFGKEQFYLLIVGSIIVLISWVMDEGRKIKEENTYTI